MFRDEPGVLKLSNEGRNKRKRDYVTLRVPETVVIRVYNRRSGDGSSGEQTIRHFANAQAG